MGRDGRRVRRSARACATAALVAVTAAVTFAGRQAGAAPAATAPSVGGCPLFPADNPWNRPVTGLPVRAESATWLESAREQSDRLHADFGSDPTYGIPYAVVGAKQPTVAVRFDEAPDESDRVRYPIPKGVAVEAGDDHHVLVVQQGSCRLFELYNARRAGSGWVAGSGAVFNLRSNAVRPKGWTSADAAGLAILPGLVRYDEVAAGAIRHALRVTFPATQDGFIFPARHHAGKRDVSLPPMGARLRLRADVDVSGYTGQARVILDALRTYGMIVADNGSGWFITGAPDPRWDDDDLAQLKDVPGSAFEFVDNGAVERN